MSVTAARGFVAGAASAGISSEPRLDLAVVRSTAPAVGAAMFTTNRVQAAPVTVSRAHLDRAEPQAVVVNAGVANAATGAEGERNAVATTVEAARQLGLRHEQVLVCSTGKIGVQLPMKSVLRGVRDAVRALSPTGGDEAAEAILTSDRRSKTAAVADAGFVVGGMAKGSAMVHPALATLLCVITTDYPLASGEAKTFLRSAVEPTLNRISIDGECSTNDTVVLLANGASGTRRRSATDRSFASALLQVCSELSSQILSDGDGATTLIRVVVAGGTSDSHAAAVARRVATSPLVKVAVSGRDANWGRVVAAAGSTPDGGGFAPLDVSRLSLKLNGTEVFRSGDPVGVAPSLDGDGCTIALDLGLGEGAATYSTTDLTCDYVLMNAAYRS